MLRYNQHFIGRSRSVQDAEFKLMLYPNDINYKANIIELEGLLSEIGLIDKEITGKKFKVGDNFLSLLTFMGCSPNIELEPQKDKPFCYIELNSSEKAQLVFGSNLKKGQCTHCKAKVSKISKELQCLTCAKPLELSKINWRKTAFVAQTWITIGNIYELEAIPNDALLNTLKSKTRVEWKPAYIRNTVTFTINQN